MRESLDSVVRNCPLRRWHLFDSKDQKSEFHTDEENGWNNYVGTVSIWL